MLDHDHFVANDINVQIRTVRENRDNLVELIRSAIHGLIKTEKHAAVAKKIVQSGKPIAQCVAADSCH